MPKKCKKQCKSQKQSKCCYNPCCSCNNNYNGNYNNNYNNGCYNPCNPCVFPTPCPQPCPTPCPPICPPCPTGGTGTTGGTFTDIALTGTGPFSIGGAGQFVSFTVRNVSLTTADNVTVTITPTAAVTPVITTTTQGAAAVQGGNTVVWSVGQLLPGGFATITFNQIGAIAPGNTWNGVATTTTPEIFFPNNFASVFVPTAA